SSAKQTRRCGRRSCQVGDGLRTPRPHSFVSFLHPPIYQEHRWKRAAPWRVRAFSCAGKLDGQKLWEKYFLNEVWGWHFSSLLVSASNLPCWLVEESVVAEECAPCSSFQAKTTPECGSTGYVEKITCSSSKRNEFRSCRSAVMEQHLFWKFEGAVVGVALVFACLVIIRQRQLDRKALEKVRKQIESI
uniref:Protein JTB n=1 Tax=Equus asinus TaxID=9793 RepID=A0A9L0JNG1_EQUAS